MSPPTKAKQSVSDLDRVKLGDKDMRSMLAEEKLRVAQELAGGGYSRDQLVDMINAPGVQQGEVFVGALDNDPRINAILKAGNEGAFVRPELESSGFVGEGQFGRVSEFTPGYVLKEQAPLVEFQGYRRNDDGSASPLGNLIGPARIQDYRDVAEEVDQLNTLNRVGVTPKVENFTVNPDGSTEVLMRDLRENYETGDDYLDNLQAKYDKGDDSQKAQAFKDGAMFQVKRKQQEAMAAMKGIELLDRHDGNVMAHKLMGRPLQIDPSGRRIDGIDKDLTLAQKAVEGMRAAGANEEANIFAGLVNEAQERGDFEAVHDLTQQGASRLMKIKKSASVPFAQDMDNFRVEGNFGLPVMNESAFA